MKKKAEVEFNRVRKLEDGSYAPYEVDVLLYLLDSSKKIEKLMEELTELLGEFLEGEE